ncbi:DNA ligase 1-like [Ctenocephalides felis]|uniref:DNA ligase 1-like n=1 Tax=Ctenocephalides felis TaxID=7515 RepID=UPI000E6E4B94|nr:DNA ligase 1-like [Ctenocephalides felis]
MADSFDLIVLGCYYGKGKRTGNYGGFLMGCYNDELGKFETEGTQPDVWIEPEEIWEVEAAGLSSSPVYTAGSSSLGSGLSLRFPRFIREREDKNVDSSTNSSQIVKMYYNLERGENFDSSDEKIVIGENTDVTDQKSGEVMEKSEVEDMTKPFHFTQQTSLTGKILSEQLVELEENEYARLEEPNEIIFIENEEKMSTISEPNFYREDENDDTETEDMPIQTG